MYCLAQSRPKPNRQRPSEKPRFKVFRRPLLIAARQLDVSRVTLSRLLNGKTAISADMAIRLHEWLEENSPSPESWLHQQADYDLWQAAQKERPHITPAYA
ncbi:TPA: HigA family addiction module antitoxin [Neisseria bacilliformis]